MQIIKSNTNGKLVLSSVEGFYLWVGWGENRDLNKEKDTRRRADRGSHPSFRTLEKKGRRERQKEGKKIRQTRKTKDHVDSH